MKSTLATISDVIIFEPRLFSDLRGYFLEVYNERSFAALGLTERFVQDSQSHSKQGVLRGMHYQLEQPQGKLVSVLQGEIFDVAVDLRPNSPSFGKWVGETLSGENHKMIWIPKGFAHGFYTISDSADVAYKVTDFYAPQHERTLLWNDADLAITWPLRGEPVLSDKDKVGHALRAFQR
jgi:dTDP-4-dehydrorhamnose 3,5-epimerase